MKSVGLKKSLDTRTSIKNKSQQNLLSQVFILIKFLLFVYLDFSRLPNELNWKDQAARRRAKTRKLNETSLEEKIAKLEKKESTNNDNEVSIFKL